VLGDKSSSNEQWAAIVKEADLDGNGEIDIKEFKTLMLKTL
jgi:Ca2+-binding EF-hand superfamily protein